jgi:ABC-type sugar transport system permease subunit
MITSATRVFLGCIAGAIAVLVFHQTTLQMFFWLGLAPQAAFRIAYVAPFNVPMVVSITFWGALYGSLFGWVSPRLKGPLWLNGLAAGFCAMLLSWFVVRPIGGEPMAYGWQHAAMLRSFVAHEMWGLGVSLILPLLLPRQLTGSRRGWAEHRLAG